MLLNGYFVAKKRKVSGRIRVHEVELRSVQMGRDSERARIVVVITFSGINNPTSQQHIVEQIWRYQTNRWRLIGRKRVREDTEAKMDWADLY